MGKCFVIQPFDKGKYDKRYTDIFGPAIIQAGLEPYRVDYDPAVEVPIEDIENGIRDSDACFAEVTTNNPNVWYEVGFARALDRPIIFVCSSERTENYPFDVRHRNILNYKVESLSDFDDLKSELSTRLKAIIEKRSTLQGLSLLSQPNGEDGLEPHELALMIVIMSYSITNPNGLHPSLIIDEMRRAGFTKAAASVGIASLNRKGYLGSDVERDFNGEEYNVYFLLSSGEDWLLKNQNKIELKISKQSKPVVPENEDDLPF